jgi:hypothetical protein
VENVGVVDPFEGATGDFGWLVARGCSDTGLYLTLTAQLPAWGLPSIHA